MEEHCGVLDPSNPCRCRRRIGAAIGRGRVDPEELLFVERVDALKLEMQRFTDAGAIFRSHPEPTATTTRLSAPSAHHLRIPGPPARNGRGHRGLASSTG
jgi:hypothetical protein